MRCGRRPRRRRAPLSESPAASMLRARPSKARTEQRCRRSSRLSAPAKTTRRRGAARCFARFSEANAASPSSAATTRSRGSRRTAHDPRGGQGRSAALSAPARGDRGGGRGAAALSRPASRRDDGARLGGVLAISRGAYRGPDDRAERESETLIALGADGGSKEAAQLSKGARFQLYLALRVAGYHDSRRRGRPRRSSPTTSWRRSIISAPRRRCACSPRWAASGQVDLLHPPSAPGEIARPSARGEGA